MRRPVLSIGSFFTITILLFFCIFIFQGTGYVLFRIDAQLTEFERHGETFLQVASLLLRKQVDKGEDALHAITPGEAARNGGHEVLVAATLDGNRIVRGMKGWLPDGTVLPGQLLTDEWTVTDLLDLYDRNLLARVLEMDGKKIFAALRLEMDELNVFGDHNILPIISDLRGRIVWMGETRETMPLAEHLKARGFVLRKKLPDKNWSLLESHQGSRVLLRQEPLPFGLMLTIAYPLRNLLLSAFSGLAVNGILFAAGFALLLFFWLVWKRGIYSSITEIACLADEMNTQLSEIDTKDPLRGAEALFNITRRFTGFNRTFVREMNAFLDDLRSLFEVILRQQEELTAFNEEAEAMNQELEEVNNRLLLRESLWERTLEFSRTFASNEDVDAAISSTLSTLRRDIGAFGVLLSSVEEDSFRLTAWSGYNDEITDFVISKEGIAATETIISRSPLWVEDMDIHPTARPVHPAVKSELLIPLFQAGEEEGVLEVAFDRKTRMDPFLIETLTPVASYLGGLIHGEKLRLEVKASYSYLAEKLQFVTGIYHDETEAHIARIGEYCRILAKAIGRDSVEQDNISLFARLHDIGKLRVPQEILAKPGPLNQEEFGYITRHPEWGAEILGDASWLAMARNICLTHHEKWDGSGYPRGLRGEEIPWEGRIAAIADIYDALRSSRAYKQPFSHEKAVEIITKGDGRVQPEHFDPAVLDAFKRLSDTFGRIFDSTCDERDAPNCPIER
jgi:HD-GYP domain-containing protein (c-di-GMP phosphodiesterase class II)